MFGCTLQAPERNPEAVVEILAFERDIIHSTFTHCKTTNNGLFKKTETTVISPGLLFFVALPSTAQLLLAYGRLRKS